MKCYENINQFVDSFDTTVKLESIDANVESNEDNLSDERVCVKTKHVIDEWLTGVTDWNPSKTRHRIHSKHKTHSSTITGLTILESNP